MTYGRSAYHSDPVISEAIERTFQTHPYYASAVQRLRIVADPNVPTMATSHEWVTHYNPTTVAGWTVAERAAVIVHELEHLLRDHHGRCGDRDPGQFNVASDAEINQRLAELPAGAVYPESLGMPRGRTAEIYYGAAGGAKSKEPDGNDNSDGTADGDGTGSGSDADGANGSGSGSGMPGPGQPGQCGSSAGGPLQSHELGDARNPGAGAANGGADARAEVAREIMGGRHPGTGEGDELREWAEGELGIDRARWYTALASIVGSVAAPHGAPTRWSWPGRRDPRDLGGAVVPRWTGERPSLAVIVDTSSSVTPADLDMARTAGQYISRVAEVTYYSCDTTPHNLGRALPAKLPGGGGTDLRRGIAMAIAEGARAIIVITDCGTPWPDEPTRVPVIIAANYGAIDITTNPAYGGQYVPPEWMTVIPLVSAD